MRAAGARIRLAQSNASLSGFVVGINTTEVASRQRELGLALLSLCLVALLLLSACLFACVLHPAYVLRLTMMPWA